jgi:hypothetical protein
MPYCVHNVSDSVGTIRVHTKSTHARFARVPGVFCKIRNTPGARSGHAHPKKKHKRDGENNVGQAVVENFLLNYQ